MVCSKAVAGCSLPTTVSLRWAAELIHAKIMSDELVTIHHLYQGPLGQVFRQGQVFLASKDGIPTGQYSTFDEAMATL
jgi:hypothetical protein